MPQFGGPTRTATGHPAVDRPKRRLAIFIYSLRGGGAQRVAAYLAEGLAKTGDEVLLITELGPEMDQFPVLASVRRLVIGIPGTGNLLGKLMRMACKVIRLRSLLRRERPDMLVSFMTRGNNMALLATAGTRTPVVICERNDPRYNPDLPIDRRLRRHLYRRADLLVAQTPIIERVMRDQFGVRNTATIPNPCMPIHGSLLTPGAAPGDRPYVLAVGRLTAQKGFDVLIRAFAQSIARNHLDLVITGEGGDRARLEQLARDVGVDDSVHMPGYVDQPYPMMLGCRMFVLSSLFEGFPNVLLEVMSLGRPVISTALPSGAHAMIEDGVSGLVVPPGDVDALKAAINCLASNPAAAEEIGGAARRAVEPYHLHNVIARWRDVLATVPQARGK